MQDVEPDLGQTLQTIQGALTRLRWWIILPAALIALATIALTFALQDRYESEAVMVVVQPQVPQAVVAPITTSTVTDSVNAIMREILSQNRLLAIIEEFDLYPNERSKKASPHVLAERMRKDLVTEIQESTSTFKISFTTTDPHVAQRVISRVISLLIEENLKTKGNQVTKTADFLSDQLEAAKQKLDAQEKRLADFKRNNLGVLPDQQTSNISALADVRMQLTTVASNQRRAQDQRASLESLIGGNLAKLEADRSALLARLTPRHPEVLKKDQEVAKVRALLDRLHAGTHAGPPLATSPDDFSTAQLINQIDANVNEIESLAADERRLRAESAQYQQRMNTTPLVEQQLAGLNRDYELVKQDYAELINKQLRSQHSASLEERQEGQTFRLVDSPTLPLAPSSPNRGLISIVGAVVGLAVGLALAFLNLLKDRCLYSEKELKCHFSLPLVVAVPVLSTAAEQRKLRLRRFAEWTAGATIVLVVGAAEAFVFRHG